VALSEMALGAERQEHDQYECLLVDLEHEEEFNMEFGNKIPYLTHIMNEDGIKVDPSKKGGFVRFVLEKSDVYGDAVRACEQTIRDEAAAEVDYEAAKAAPGKLYLTDAKKGRLANIMTRTHVDICQQMLHTIGEKDKVFKRFKDVTTGLHDFRDQLTKGELGSEPVDILFAYGMGCGKGPNKWTETELVEGREAWEEKWKSDADYDPERYQATPMRRYLCQWRDDIVNRATEANKQPPIRSMTFVTGAGELAVCDIREEDIPHFPKGQQAYIRAVKYIARVRAQAKEDVKSEKIDADQQKAVDAQLNEALEQLKPFLALEQQLRLKAQREDTTYDRTLREILSLHKISHFA